LDNDSIILFFLKILIQTVDKRASLFHLILTFILPLVIHPMCPGYFRIISSENHCQSVVFLRSCTNAFWNMNGEIAGVIPLDK
jgi:hypothetical protein